MLEFARMIIGIDASRYVHDSATGVEYYSRHIIDNLLVQIAKNPSDKVILYSKTYLAFPNLPRNAKIKVIKNKYLWTLDGLSKEIKKNPPDVLFVPSHVLPLSLPKKSVITIHDVAFRRLRRSYSFFQYHYLNWSTKFAVKHATKIIVPSLSTKYDLIDIFKCPKDKIVVIPHGFEPPEIFTKFQSFNDMDILKYANLDKNMKYMFFVGRLETKKNIFRLIQAFQLFRHKHSNYWLILGGKRGAGFRKILRLSRKRNLLTNVLMPGYITDEEKSFLFQNCKFFVFPSLYEGFGLPLLEAFFYKKPVLTSGIKVIKQVCGKAACYCDPNDIEVIKTCMLRIAEHEDYADRLIKLGIERLKNFSWKTASKKTLNVLKDG